MGLFTKEECVFCGNKVGFFSRNSLSNKTGVICKECEKKCSPLVNVGRLTKDQASEHIKYMERQNELYEKAFLPLGKNKKQRFVYQFTGVEFADEIAMFAFISPKDKKKVNRELFRYDQIKSYEPYTIKNANTQNGKKYSEVGMVIKLYCSNPSIAPESKDNVGRDYHPYVSELKVPTGKNVDDEFSSRALKRQLDLMAGIYEDDSLLGSMKEKFTGSQKDRNQIAAAASGLKALGSLAKAKMSGSEEDMENAKKQMEDAKDKTINLITKNRKKYTEIANAVEKSILG